jgi:hypothetical protein
MKQAAGVLSRSVWVRFVLQKHKSRLKRATPFVLYRVLQLIQAFAKGCCLLTT